MGSDNRKQLSAQIIDKAMSFGASLVGIASVDALRRSPSHRIDDGVSWPQAVKSAIVLALHHPHQEASLDWWDNRAGRTPGNRALIRISDQLGQWLQGKWAVNPYPVAYNIEKGGIYLKDAAAIAGLGVIGRNNLLVTPRFGTRVRLRALLIDVELETIDHLTFDPCAGCPAPCIAACPQDALQGGSYEKRRCCRQLEKDENNPHRRMDVSSMTYSIVCIKYCRACELACPVSV
jgi:epoxyqueuosine reductase